MFEELKNIKSGIKELRQFGLTIGIATGLLGGLFHFRGKDFFLYFYFVSLGFLSLGLIRPQLLKPIQKIWMSLAICIGWVVTRVILLILYYCVVTPIGIFGRIFSKSFLDLKIDKNATSYWIPLETSKVDKKRYENQF